MKEKKKLLLRHQHATSLAKQDILRGCLGRVVLVSSLRIERWIERWKRIIWKCVFRRWRVASTASEEAKVENPLRSAVKTAYIVDLVATKDARPLLA